MARQKAGMDRIEQWKGDQGKLISVYTDFHKIIQTECQTICNKSRLRNGIMTSEHSKVCKDAYKIYNKKKAPVWKKFKADQTALYDKYVLDEQELGFYPEYDDGKD